MAMTAQDVIDAARRAISDDMPGTTGLRWSQEALLGYVNRAYRRLLRDRPDLMLTAIETLGAVETLEATDELIVDEAWLEPLCACVAASALEEDGTDLENMQRAAALRAIYAEAIG